MFLKMQEIFRYFNKVVVWSLGIGVDGYKSERLIPIKGTFYLIMII